RRNDHPELPSPFLALFFDVVLPALEFVRSPRKNCDSYLDLAERADRILPALQLGHLQDEGVKSGPQFRDGRSCLPLLSPDPLHLLAGVVTWPVSVATRSESSLNLSVRLFLAISPLDAA